MRICLGCFFLILFVANGYDMICFTLFILLCNNSALSHNVPPNQI